MIKQSKIRIHSIYVKLMAAFLLLIIPIFATGLVSNDKEQDIIRNSIFDSLHSKVNFYSVLLTSELKNLQDITYEYMHESDFVKLAVLYDDMSDYQKTESILDVRSKLVLLRNISPYVNNLFIYLPSMGRSVNALNYDYELSNSDVEAMMKLLPYDKLVLSHNNKLFIRSFFPSTLLGEKKPEAILAIELSKTQISKMLKEIENSEGSGSLLIGRDWYISPRDIRTQVDNTWIVEETAGMAFSAENQVMSWQSKGYLLVGHYVEAMDAVLLIYLPQHQVLLPLLNAQKWIAGLSILSIFLVVIAAFAVYKMVHKPMHRLVSAFIEVEQGERNAHIPVSKKDEFGYLYSRFNNMMDTLNHLIEQVYEQRILSQQSQFKQLQTQINPHFFFNSFFILRGMIDMGDNETASFMLKNLGDYFQYITRSGKDYISLREEMSHAIAYCEVQKLRFERIDVRISEMPDEMSLVKVPRLIIQPLLENAYKYGFEGKEEDGEISIDFSEDKQFYRICICNGGASMETDELQKICQKLNEAPDSGMETTAVINIHRRLQLYFGPLSGLEIQNNQPTGTIITIKIPKTKEV